MKTKFAKIAAAIGLTGMSASAFAAACCVAGAACCVAGGLCC
jgi:hypothetical protein